MLPVINFDRNIDHIFYRFKFIHCDHRIFDFIFQFFIKFWCKRGIIPFYCICQCFESWSVYHCWLGLFQNQQLFFNCPVFVLISKSLFYVNAKIVKFVKHLLRFLLLFFVFVFQKNSNRGCTQLKVVPSKYEIANNIFFVGNTVGYALKLIATIVNHGFRIPWTFENLLGLVTLKPPCTPENISIKFCCPWEVDMVYFKVFWTFEKLVMTVRYQRSC